MKTHFLILLFGACLCLQSCKNAEAKGHSNLEKDSIENWKLVWEDNFDVDGLPNSTFWDYDLADGCPQVCGWGNNELQYYTKAEEKNARVKDGHLIIEAHKTKMGRKDYTSARLVTRGKSAWDSGKIEVKAKLPKGLGTWPAIWMLPEDNTYGGWPKSGEIDIMEHVGYCPDTIFGTVHTEAFNHLIGTQVGSGIYKPDSEGQFHTYGLIWGEKSISWLIDGEEYHRFDNRNKSYKEWPFDKPFHLILNLAVGGNWGGKHGVDPNVFPQSMVVDYVKVYENHAG